MSAVETNLPTLTAQASTAGRRWARFESWLSAVSDRLNPILVKETRQALKSTQFALTFFLLLVGGWMWSIIGVAMYSPTVYYTPTGPEMLSVYYMGLDFPLLVIVPFVAFRSIVGEREDGTYELLSISTLRPRQIILGKLGSAMLQMLIYLSALAPCIAFTYLLRGVDIITIGLLLAVAAGLSLLLSAAAILLGTVTRLRHWNSVLSVFIILGLLFVYMSFTSVVMQGIFREFLAAPYETLAFWTGAAFWFSAGLAYVVLLLTAAAARITFASENRSTALRWVMLGIQTLGVGWGTYYAISERTQVVLAVFMVWATLNWYAFGMFVNGESAFLSERARRRLPQSFLARLLLTWLNPGPRTGFIFVTSCLGAVMLLMISISLAGDGYFSEFSPRSANSTTMTWFAAASWAYVTLYLGVGHALIALGRRITRVDMAVAVIVQPLLVFLGVMGPLVPQMAFFHNPRYSLLQVSNPFWTLVEILETRNNMFSPVGGLFPPLLLLLVGSAVIMFLVQLVFSLRDITFERAAVPARVQEEEQALAPPKPVLPQRTSPWNEGK